MGMGASRPKKTAEEEALMRAQTRELGRTQEEINEKKRRILRSQTGGRSSLLSGSERGVQPGETRLMRGGSGNAGGGRDLRQPLGMRGGVSLLGGGRRGQGGRRQSL